MEQEAVELVMWEDVRRDMKYPKEDNNNGYIYGLNLIDEEADNEVIEVQWFLSEDERHDFIIENNFKIIND